MYIKHALLYILNEVLDDSEFMSAAHTDNFFFNSNKIKNKK